MNEKYRIVCQMDDTWMIQERCGLLVPRNQYHGLCIEMKTKSGRQSSEQGLWQLKVEKYGYKYAVCRSLEDFIATVEGYLNQSGESPRPVGSHD